MMLLLNMLKPMAFLIIAAFLHRAACSFFKKPGMLIKTMLIMPAAAASAYLAGKIKTGVSASAIAAAYFIGIIIATDIVMKATSVTAGLICGKRAKSVCAWLNKSGIIAVSVTILTLAAAYMNLHTVAFKEYEIRTDKEINDTRIIFLSDLHMGSTMNIEKLAEYCRRMESKNPDAVILGGDIVDEYTSREDMETCMALLGSIKSRYGTIYALGNHDDGLYRKDCEFTQAQLKETAIKAGITLLEDSLIETENISITGRIDRLSAKRDRVARKSHAELIKETDAGKFLILADHEPYEMENAAKAGFDLMLSGHNHGGQIWPVNLIMKAAKKDTQVYGLEQYDGMACIVSSGMGGCDVQFRTAGRCEIVIIDIKSAK